MVVVKGECWCLGIQPWDHNDFMMIFHFGLMELFQFWLMFFTMQQFHFMLYWHICVWEIMVCTCGIHLGYYTTLVLTFNWMMMSSQLRHELAYGFLMGTYILCLWDIFVGITRISYAYIWFWWHGWSFLDCDYVFEIWCYYGGLQHAFKLWWSLVIISIFCLDIFMKAPRRDPKSYTYEKTFLHLHGFITLFTLLCTHQCHAHTNAANDITSGCILT